MSEVDIHRLKQDIVFDATMRGRRLVFHSTWGLFSPRRIDDGTWMLVEKAEVGGEDLTLELGCGYGAIGLAVAALAPAGKVHMVDKDFVALEYAAKNAALNGIENVEIYPSNAFSAVPAEMRFDNIMANLPANTGKELLSIVLHDAKAHLKPGGRLYVVTIAGLRQFIRRNFEEVFGNYAKLKQGKTYTVALAVRD
jgi:16S rRNA (guanine1207-N2)-methyltransferase